MSILPLVPFMPLTALSEFMVPLLEQLLGPTVVVGVTVYCLLVLDSVMEWFASASCAPPIRRYSREYILSKRYYNWCQVIFNLCMAIYGLTCLVLDWPVSLRLWINVPPARNTANPLFLNAHVFVVLHGWNKLLDLLDTFFIIHEEKWERLTFLHVYHHVCTLLIWTWLVVIRNGDCRPTIVFGALLNSIIHALMYTYYNLSMHPKMGPWVRKRKLWLTGAQMVQLSMGCIHAVAVGLLDTTCREFPLGWLVQFVFLSHLLYLFSRFFLREYIKGERPIVKE